jgi:hypothetical protein
MRNTLAIVLLSSCSSPTDTGNDVRTPFIPGSGGDDSGQNPPTGYVPRVTTESTGSIPVLGGDDVSLHPWFDPGIDVPVFDCSKVLDPPLEINELDEPRGYHDVIFDTEGNLIGSDGYHLTASPDDSSNRIWVPNAGDVQGMDWLPDGDIVAASGAAIVRINPEEGKSVIASDVWAYGVLVGPDGMVYLGSGMQVIKLDPENGDWEVFVDPPGDITVREVNFSPDFSRMYIGTLAANAPVLAVDLDEDLEPLDDAYVFAEHVGAGYHDGMGVDVCGNIYVNDYSSFSFYRVSPLGEVTLLQAWNWTNMGYGHGQEFGSGLSVWRTDAIYVPQPYDGNTVAEVVVGIPSRLINGGVYEVINEEK